MFLFYPLALSFRDVIDDFLEGKRAALSSTSSDRRGALSLLAIGDMTITPSPSWDNETFASVICPSFNSATTSFGVSIVGSPGTFPRLFELPDCLFNYGSLLKVTLFGVFVSGNATYPDPLERLETAMNKVSTNEIFIANSFLQTHGSTLSTYAPGWDDLFSAYPNLKKITMLNCSLSGTLPSRLPSILTTFSVSTNSLTGTIPSTLFENYANVSSTNDYSMSLNANSFTGTIPGDLLFPIPAGCTFSFYVNNNLLSGSIPRNLLNINRSSTIVGLVLNLGTNNFIDTLPTDLWGLPTTMNALTYLNIYGSYLLQLSGTINSAWISRYSFPQMSTLTISLPNCQISGNLHSGLIPASAPKLAISSIMLTQNPLKAPILPSLLSAVLALPNTAPGRPKWVISADKCNVNGSLSLPSPPSIATNLATIDLYVGTNTLTSFSASVDTTKYLSYLDVSNNPNMTGTVENLFSSSPSVLTVLSGASTLLSGTMPYMANMNTSVLLNLRLNGLAIDFCGGSARAPWAPSPSRLMVCNLFGTDAVNTCPSLYPTICGGTAVPVPASPISSPIPIAPSCSESTKPSPQFECVDGVWVSNTTVTTPTLTIPSGASETIVIGDVESSSIVFTGLGSSLTINGCASNLTSITLTLTPDDLKGSSKIVQQLVTFANSNCSTDNLSNIDIEPRVKGSTCRKVKASKSISNGQLSGIFTIDSSSCNRWWIILVSVICGAIVIALVIFVLLVIFVPAVRVAVRPFSARRKQNNDL